MRQITLKEIEYTAFQLAQKTLKWNEPIPPFETRQPNLLESCLATPFQRFSGKKLYKGLISKAAVLFYLMIKNHPFQNGNKRIAVTTLFMFLYLNKKWLEVDNQILYNFAVWVAESPPDLGEETRMAIEKFIRKNIVNL